MSTSRDSLILALKIASYCSWKDSPEAVVVQLHPSMMFDEKEILPQKERYVTNEEAAPFGCEVIRCPVKRCGRPTPLGGFLVCVHCGTPWRFLDNNSGDIFAPTSRTHIENALVAVRSSVAHEEIMDPKHEN